MGVVFWWPTSEEENIYNWICTNHVIRLSFAHAWFKNGVMALSEDKATVVNRQWIRFKEASADWYMHMPIYWNQSNQSEISGWGRGRGQLMRSGSYFLLTLWLKFSAFPPLAWRIIKEQKGGKQRRRGQLIKTGSVGRKHGLKHLELNPYFSKKEKKGKIWRYIRCFSDCNMNLGGGVRRRSHSRWTNPHHHPLHHYSRSWTEPRVSKRTVGTGPMVMAEQETGSKQKVHRKLVKTEPCQLTQPLLLLLKKMSWVFLWTQSWTSGEQGVCVCVCA